MSIRPGDIVGDGKFVIQQELGRGGMGVVLLAQHRALGAPFALKILRPELAGMPRVALRFEREARAASTLSSKHTRRVFDVGSLEDGRPFLVMDFLDGIDLEKLLSLKRQLPLREAVRYVRHACAALQEAHDSGFVHRDIKPSNLFLVDDARGVPHLKVLDFGIAKALASAEGALTSDSSLLGTPRYMSPEQMRSAISADIRSDVWSLGAVLFELLVGSPPFGGANLPEVCASILESPSPNARRFRREIPRSLNATIRKCLSRDPAARFQSVAALSRALAPFDDSVNPPGPAATSSPVQRSALIRRAPILAAAIAVLAGIPADSDLPRDAGSSAVAVKRTLESERSTLVFAQRTRLLDASIHPISARPSARTEKVGEAPEDAILQFGRF